MTKAGWTYEYDWDHQLTKAIAPDGKIIEFWYDTQGHRLRKAVTVGGTTTTTHYVVDAELPYAQVLLETDAANQITAKYTYADDLLKVSRNGEYYYFTDGLGSTRLLTDAAGAVVNRYTYDAYGKQLPTECEATVENEYLFTGERTDADTGLVYLRARYYDPATGRFTRRDDFPGFAADPLTLHRYVYVNASPTNYTDPSGHMLAGFAIQTMSTMDSLNNIRHAELEIGRSIVEELAVIANPASAGAITAIQVGEMIYDVYTIAKDINFQRLLKEAAERAALVARRATKGASGKVLRYWDDVGDLISDANRWLPRGQARVTWDTSLGIRNVDGVVIGRYKDLKGQIPGAEAHHLIEKRFDKVFKIKEKDMTAVLLDGDTHQMFTNKWRKEIPYGTDYTTLKPDYVLEKAREIYADYPPLLRALGID